MTVTLKFYGQLRDIIGKNEEEIEVKENTTIADLAEAIGQRFPKLREHLQTVSFAVDNEYAPKGTVLMEGNEVGLLPPISGGTDG